MGTLWVCFWVFSKNFIFLFQGQRWALQLTRYKSLRQSLYYNEPCVLFNEPSLPITSFKGIVAQFLHLYFFQYEKYSPAQYAFLLYLAVSIRWVSIMFNFFYRKISELCKRIVYGILIYNSASYKRRN